MTTTIALSRQSSEIDDSSDGGFQFSHPLFAASATPMRTERFALPDSVAHTSPVVSQRHAEAQALMTPLAQPTYTRFGRRQPLGTRTHSSDGNVADTPAHTTHGTTTKASASVARWKRTGRIGLGPPKRAERQSIDPEDDGLGAGLEAADINKENENPDSMRKSSSSSSSSPPSSGHDLSIRGLANHRSSTSPSYLHRSLQSNRSEATAHSQYSLQSQHAQIPRPTQTIPPARDPLADLMITDVKQAPLQDDRPRIQGRVSSGSVSPTEGSRSPSKDSSFTTDPDLQKSRIAQERTSLPLQIALSPVPEPQVATDQKIELIPLIRSVPSDKAQAASVPVAPVYQDRPPPPKMTLDGPAPTGTRKAKALGRIVMNGREYTRLDQIGKGGSSKVFRVMAPNGRIFALKRVDFEQADQATIQGYKSEIDLLNRMSASSGSDRIIKLYDSEINDAKGRLLMLMEAGEIDLAHMLTKRQNEIPDFNFIRLFWRHMLEAVQAVHDQKIVHSDLKPANFLLVEGSLKLIDFGIAKAIGNDTTNIHRDQQVGTVNYMSPEALSDTGGNNGRMMKLGRASDVWSLGCILYQMVYGRTPFSHLTMIQKIQAIPSGTHRIEFPMKAYPPSTMNDKIRDESSGRTVDGDLLRVMRGCLERDQTQRLTIEQLLADPFLRPEDKTVRTAQEGSVHVNLGQITELLRLAVSQTREKTLQRETIHTSDVENLAKDFFDRLRWAA